jgi:hypothetical protein
MFTMALCGPCKISMHVRTAVYCIENGIGHVTDGANREVRYDPYQRRAGQAEMKRFYSNLGIDYANLLSMREFPEKRSDFELYELGFSDIRDVKETEHDLQGACRTVCVNDLYSRGLFEAFNSSEDFEAPTQRYFREKLDEYSAEIDRHLRGGSSRLARLIKAPDGD